MALASSRCRQGGIAVFCVASFSIRHGHRLPFRLFSAMFSFYVLPPSLLRSRSTGQACGVHIVPRALLAGRERWAHMQPPAAGDTNHSELITNQ